MDRERRDYLRAEVDKRARKRAEGSYLDLDPESLTAQAAEFDQAGYPELGDTFRHLRDQIVNPLLGEGWSLERIEEAYLRAQGSLD